MVGGEPGIGKSRLVERLLGTARERGALVLTARCWEAGGAPAYWPWVETLRAYVRAAGAEAVRRQAAPDVARIVPELAPEGTTLAPDDSEGARFRLFEAIGDLLAAAARERPLVVALDDLHAADDPSLLLLRLLGHRLAGTRLLVVGTYRDTEMPPGSPLAAALDDLDRSGSGQRIVLRGLTGPDVARLVETIAGGRLERLSQLVLEETDGNPLFAGELVRMLVAEGSIDAAEGATAWEFGLPDALREVIGRRIAALGPQAQRGPRRGLGARARVPARRPRGGRRPRRAARSPRRCTRRAPRG